MTTKVDQSSPDPLNKINNKLLVYRYLMFLITHSLSALFQLVSGQQIREGVLRLGVDADCTQAKINKFNFPIRCF